MITELRSVKLTVAGAPAAALYHAPVDGNAGPQRLSPEPTDISDNDYLVAGPSDEALISSYTSDATSPYRLWAVRPDGSLNLLDYGAIRVFPSKFVGGVILLYEAVRDKDDDKAHHAYEIWGFKDLSREKMDVLNMWARFLYEPLIQIKS